jgi:DNA polymerase III subunit gamma/tau
MNTLFLMSDLIPAPSSSPEKSYRVLARKYRPQNFETLIGQEPMVRTLRNAFETGRIAQAWMLTGVRGVGKTTTARILARALNYKTETVDTPSVDLTEIGEHCQAIMEGRHVDVIEIDAASHTGIDNIREIIEQVRYRPVAARYKVYVIDEVHMLSTSAFNALLKTLEEPPPHVKFVFATTEIRKVPVTVLSRCQRFDLRRVEAATIVAHLRKLAGLENITVDDASLAMIARAGEGSVRDSLSIFDQAIAYGNGSVDPEQIRAMLGLADRARTIDLFEKLMRGQMAEALTEFRGQYDAGADPVAILTELAEFCHLVTRMKFVPEVADDASLTQDEQVRGKAFAWQLSSRTLSRAWQMLIKGIAETQESNRPASAAEMLLIRLAHASDLPPLDDVIKGLDSAPQTASPPSAPPAAPSGPAMRSAASGGGQPMRLAAENPQPAAPQVSEVSKPVVSLASLADITALADKHRDLHFKLLVEKYAGLVKIETGRLDINLRDGAPKTLAGDIAKKLSDWSGQRWMVSVTAEAGGQTIDEIAKSRRDGLFSDAKADPTVAAVLAQFPGAKIIDVKIFGDEESTTASIGASEMLETLAPDDDIPSDGESDLE